MPTAHAASTPYSPQRRTALVLTGIGHGRRLPRRRAARAARSRRQDRRRRRARYRRGRRAVRRGRRRAAPLGREGLLARAGRSRALYRWRPVAGLRRLGAGGWRSSPSPLPLGARSSPACSCFPVDFVLRMVGVAGAGGPRRRVPARSSQAAFAPAALPTWLPRLVVLDRSALVLGCWRPRSRRRGRGHARRERGGVWWRLIGAPLSPREASDAAAGGVLWDLRARRPRR